MGTKDEAKVGKVYKTEAGAKKLLERLPSNGYGIETAEGGYTVKKLINNSAVNSEKLEDPKVRMERIKQEVLNNPRPVNVVEPKRNETIGTDTNLFKTKKLVNPDSYDPKSEFLSQREVDKIVVNNRANADVKRHDFGAPVQRITREEFTKANADVVRKDKINAENAEYDKYIREKNAELQAKESAKNGNAATERLKIEARAEDMRAALDDGKVYNRENLYKEASESNYAKKVDIGLNILNNESPKKEYGAEKNPNASKTMDEIISGTKHNMPTNPDATMKNSGVFSDDASKYNLKNVAELEAKVGIEQARIDKIQTEGTSMFQAVTTKIGSFFGAKPSTELANEEYKIESPLFKEGVLKGNNNGADAKSADEIGELGNVKNTLKSAKEAIMKEMYEPSKEGSNIHFEKGLEKKLNSTNIMHGQELLQEESDSYKHLNGLGIDRNTELKWNKTESGGLEATYKNIIAATEDSEEIVEKRKLQVNFGNDGAISGIDAMKQNGDSWEKVDMDTIKIEGRGYVNPEKASEIANKTTKEMRKEILSGDGYAETSKWNLLKRVSNHNNATKEANEAIQSAKEGLKAHNEALGKMKANIGNAIGETGRVDMDAIAKAASGTVENVAKDAKNINAMANNTGKGMKSLVMLGAVAAGLGAIKAGFDNSAEQRRQKQLELMSLRQQYGAASM